MEGGEYRDGKIVVSNVTAPIGVSVTLASAWYVSLDGSDTENDGHSFDTAFATIHKALSVAQADDTINIAEGTYATTGTVAIAKKLTIVGAGRDATVFRGGKVNYRAFSLTAADAVLRDFSILGYSNTLFAAGCGVNMTGGTLDNVRIGWIRQGEGQGGAAPAVGSGLCMSGGTVTNCVIDHCLAWGSYGNTSGCGVYVSGGTIVDSTISYNARQRTQVDGSGIRIAGSSVKVIRCLINGNNSGGNISNDTRGMGVYMDQNALVEDCVIRDNGIQGVWMSNGTLRNCLIAGHSNSSESRASGVHMEGSAKLYNCTIWGNSAKNANAGLRMDGGTAVNNIVAGNGTLGNAGVTKGTFNTNVVCTSSSIAATTAVGNFRADPLLKDPANDDFSLTLASVALDAGAPIVGIDHDLAFVARPQGAAPDIGAYELQLAGGELQCAVVVGESAFKEGAAVTVTSRVLGGSGSYTYQWYVDGQLTDQTSESPVFEGLGIGRHTVRLVVSDGTTSAESEVPDAVTLKPSTVYVDLQGGNVFPYNTSDGAAQNIYDALDAVWCAAGDPGRVIIAEGTYPLTKCIIVSDPCVIVGAGRDLTTLDGKAISGDRGLKLSGSGTLLKDLTVTGCKNKLQGTAIMMGSGVTLDNVRVTKNERESNSGAVGTGISMSGGTVTNCLIDANTAHASYDGTKGIGVYMSGGLLVDSVVCSNKFDRNQHSGVGVCVEDGTVRRCRIFQNSSSVNDGNTRAHGLNVSGSNTIVEDCLIYSNGWNGVQIGNGTVRNCVIFGHKANTSGDHWAGVYITNGKLQNCTLYDNVASKDTTGKSGLYQTGGTVENCIIWASAASESLGGCSVTSGTFRNNISDKTIARGTDCVVADPQFVDAAAGDFHLQSSSPAVDKGRTISPFETDAEGNPVDIEGIVRPQKDAWDIGAYEYVPGKDPVVSVVALQVDFPLGGRLEAVANTENVDTNTATFAWTLRDQAGETVVTQGGTGGEFVSFAYDSQDVGVFTLSLTVTVDDQPIEAGNTVDFTVKPTETFVATTGSNEFPYDSWETAATNLNDAVSGMWMANDSTGVVHVAAGDYKLKGAITLNTPLRVLGAGRDETVIHGKYGDRGFYLSHKDAVLADLTLTGCTNSLSWVGSGVRMEKGLLRNVRITKTWIDGHSGSAAASGLYLSGGVVTNCLIDANASNASYGTTAGMGVYMTGGTLVDSVVCSNWVNRGELEGIGIRMTGGTVRRCDIFRNKGYAAGDSHGMNLLASAENVASVIEDCRIHDGLSGVQAWGGNVTFRNCLIYGHNYTLGTSAGLITGDGTKVYNCTIAGNTCTKEDCGDASFWNGATVKNTIACSAVTGETAKVTFSCLNQPVAFKRGYRLTGNGNPCVNAGDNSVWNGIAEPKDLGGRPRILEKVVDLGCFEHEPTGFSLIVR